MRVTSAWVVNFQYCLKAETGEIPRMEGRTWLLKLAAGLWAGLYSVHYVKAGAGEQKGSERVFLSASFFLPRQSIANSLMGRESPFFAAPGSADCIAEGCRERRKAAFLSQVVLLKAKHV